MRLLWSWPGRFNLTGHSLRHESNLEHYTHKLRPQYSVLSLHRPPLGRSVKPRPNPFYIYLQLASHLPGTSRSTEATHGVSCPDRDELCGDQPESFPDLDDVDVSPKNTGKPLLNDSFPSLGRDTPTVDLRAPVKGEAQANIDLHHIRRRLLPEGLG